MFYGTQASPLVKPVADPLSAVCDVHEVQTLRCSWCVQARDAAIRAVLVQRSALRATRRRRSW